MTEPADSMPLLEPVDGILAVLDRGSATGTNKFGLLLVLLEAASECGPDRIVEARTLAERSIELHWEHARPFDDTVLRQLTSSNRDNTQVMMQTLTVRDSLPVAIRDLPFERVRPHMNPTVWHKAIAKVELDLWRNPIRRLQTLPGDPRPFLYQQHPKPLQIEFLPGVPEALTRFAPVLRPIIEFRFVEFVTRANRQSVGTPIEQQIHQHLFGMERHMPPAAVRQRLLELQNNRCVYTGHELGSTRQPVDHVVPWSRQHLSVIENFVITSTKTNSQKSNLPLGPVMIEAWTEHLARHSAELASVATENGWPTDRQRLLAAMRNIYSALHPSTGVWDGEHGIRVLGEVGKRRINDRLADTK